MIHPVVAVPRSQAAQASVALELWMEVTNMPPKGVAGTPVTWKVTKPSRQMLKMAFLFRTI